MNLVVSLYGFTLLLTLSFVPHLHTPEHDRIGYGPVAGDERVVSSGVLVSDEGSIIVPVEWNAGEQLLWMGEDVWEQVPVVAIEALSNEAAVWVAEVVR